MSEAVSKTEAIPGLKDLENVKTWVFDLDNTLYPARCNLFDQIDHEYDAHR